MNQTLERIRQSKIRQFFSFIGAANFFFALRWLATGDLTMALMNAVGFGFWLSGLYAMHKWELKKVEKPEFDFTKQTPRLPLIPFDGRQEVRSAYIPSERVREIIARWKF